MAALVVLPVLLKLMPARTATATAHPLGSEAPPLAAAGHDVDRIR
jgi:hypothetical protein